MENNKQNGIGFSQGIVVLRKALGVSLRVKGWESILVNVCGWAAAFLPVITARYLEQLTNALYFYCTGNGLEGETEKVLRLFAVMIVLYIVQEFYNCLSMYILEKDTIRTKRFISHSVMECKCSVKYQYIENNQDFRQKLSFVEEYAGEYTARSMQELILIVQRVISICSISMELMRVSGGIVAAIWITCLPAAVLSYLQSDDTYRFRTKWMVEGDSVIMQFITCVRPEAMKDIRHFHAYDYLKNEWGKSAKGYIQKKDALTRKHVLYNVIADILRNAVYIIILLVVGWQIYFCPEIGLGIFMLVLTLSGRLQNVISSLMISVMAFGQNISYMKDFFDLQELIVDETEETESEKMSGVSVRFTDVDFSYPGSNRKAIHDLSVEIKEGERIAIVGENGSGKSTFVNLLLGFYEPQRGDISVDKIHVNDQSVGQIRRLSAVVFQDFCHYEGTIRDNIVASDPTREMREDELQQLLEKANVNPFVDKQPAGLEEEIGQFSSTGNNLSGGQWQRLALARALYRSGTQLMILDEPTAALDPLAEAELYNNFADMTVGKTTLLISHRLGITRMVDRILVFHQGCIVEEGTHDALMEKNGYYARMYQAQAKWYQNREEE